MNNRFFLDYFLILPLAILLWWVLIVLAYFLKHRRLKFYQYAFSIRNYYLAIAPQLISLLVISLRYHSLKPLFFFSLFAVAGVFGESIFSFWWDCLFDKRFWVYRVKPIFHSYSSLLNFIPYGTGGMLYLAILEVLGLKFLNPLYHVSFFSDKPFYVIFSLGFITILIFTFVFAYLARRRKKWGFEFRKVNIANYLIFCLPITIPLLTLSLFSAIDYFYLAVFFGFIAFILEYLFGKYLVFFISKKFWYYTYFTFDRKHSTVLIILPAAAGGFLFWTVYLLAEKLLNLF